MKRLLIAMAMAMILMVATTAWADIYPAGRGVGWDEVTKDIEGNLIDPANIKYRVYVKHRDTGAQTVLGETAGFTWVPVLPGSGVFYPGVSSFGHIDGVPIADTESSITWSDSTDQVAVPVPFGLMQWYKLQAPTGLRLVP